VVSRISFENKPKMFSVSVEAYLNSVFLLDMIRNFLQPYQTKDEKYEKSPKLIAANYLKSWFLWDLFSFFPLALIRYNNVYEDGGYNK